MELRKVTIFFVVAIWKLGVCENEAANTTTSPATTTTSITSTTTIAATTTTISSPNNPASTSTSIPLLSDKKFQSSLITSSLSSTSGNVYASNQGFDVESFAFSPDGSLGGSFNKSQIIDPCERSGVCEVLEERTCLGVPLPYTHTSLSLTGLPSQRVAREHLEMWSSLRNIPRCWAVVQPLLCAVFFPRCENTSVELPSHEMCFITRGPCRLVELERGWPEFLKCHEDYPRKCKNSVRQMRFNTTGECVPPLVATEEEESWYEGVKGCGVQCASPVFTQEEHNDLHRFLATLGGVGLACATLTVCTYLIDWRAANKYPVLIIFYINCCFLIASIGFIIQFHPGVRENLTCQSDGTLRQDEPSSGGDLSCVVVFVCIYYFMVAAGVWLIILSYSLHTSFKTYAAGMSGDELERRAAYFHLVAWSLPLVLTITIMAMAQVEADSVAGICFLSSAIHIRIGFLLLPVVIVVFISGFFLIRGMKKLIYLKMECFNIISDTANTKIVETIMRLAIVTLALLTFTGITLYCHVYQYRNRHLWDRALRDYIMCVSNITSSPELGSPSSVCVLSARPSINVYKLHLLAFFGAGIIMSSWCWTPNTIQAWKRFLRRVAGVSSEEPQRLARHRVIAQAFAKRHHLNTAGRLSISLHSMHDDPLGWNFEMNSGTSGDISSTWATAIPHLMTRRGAVFGPAALALRRSSLDSEYSGSRRFSIESGHNNRSSRRHSLDSQMSFQVSEAERLAAALAVSGRSGRRKRRDWVGLRREWVGLRRGRRVNAWDRRGSNTSDDSNLGSMILPALTLPHQDTLFTNMMKHLNLSSDEPTRSERATPSVAPAPQPLNLPGQTAVDSEDETGVGDTLGPHTVLNNALKGADIRNQEEGYARNAATTEDGRASSRACNLRNNVVDVGVQVASVSVGVQTMLPAPTPRIHTADKSVQVCTPLLMRATSRTHSDSSNDSASSATHNYRTNESRKTVNETSFSTRRKPGNNGRPGTPVTNLSKKVNHSGDRISNKNVNSSHGSHKRTCNSRTGNGGSRNRRSRPEATDITVLDIAGDND
ncbi:hypothetical protein Pcinc_005354 [Petrolisthes cinctipes]|uniref:Smoothened n=1 Tax=Petrolisthes cinctipes TaxID=88211 RepID=A0AAE1GFC7_PETCI|nr:hypothetical protein Pcinc_005354 [Petrolisthes cinctipes]